MLDFLTYRHEYNKRISNIEDKRAAKKELEDMLFIIKQTNDISSELETLSNEQLISQYDYSKIEKLNNKVEGLKYSNSLHESYMYDIDDCVTKTDKIIKKIWHILVQELKNLMKNSAFFAKGDNNEDSFKDARKVFMILKSFKQLVHSEQYVYRTINNEIIDPEFNKLVQLALKSKSVISLTDKDFEKSKLPLRIFTDGAMDIFMNGSLKNLIKMWHGKPQGKYRPLSREVYISGYDIILNCILEPTKSLFETKMSFVYSPGIPMIFHANYLAVRRFVVNIEKCGVKDSKGIIKHILGKYNLSIYFTMVSREIIKEYTTKLDSTFAKGKIESGEEGVSHLVITTLQRCIGDNLFLIEVSDKILSMWIQIVIRALHVTKETINKKSMSAENLLRILDEVTKIDQYMNYDFLDQLSEICSKSCEKNAEAIIQSLSDSYRELYDLLSTRIDSLNHPWIKAASEKITQRLAENMRQFKQIAGVFRLTSKKAPTVHSDYTNVTFKPVENLVSKEFFTHLSIKLKTLLLNSIFQKSLWKLHGILSEMLEEEKAKSNPLTKFSKDGAKNTDYDNICVQVYLDIKDLENRIDELGGSREYTELQDLYNLVSSYMGPGCAGMYQ